MSSNNSDIRTGKLSFIAILLVIAAGFALIRLVIVGPVLFFGTP